MADNETASSSQSDDLFEGECLSLYSKNGAKRRREKEEEEEEDNSRDPRPPQLVKLLD